MLVCEFMSTVDYVFLHILLLLFEEYAKGDIFPSFFLFLSLSFKHDFFIVLLFFLAFFFTYFFDSK